MTMEYWLSYLNQALIFGVLAVPLNILVGYSGIFSIGSAAFAAVGGYLTAVLTVSAGWGTLSAAAAAIVVGAVVGALVSGPLLRLADEYVMLMTMSLAILCVTVIVAVPALGGQQGIVGIPTPTILGLGLMSQASWVPVLVVVLTVVALLCWRLGESPWGRLLRATRDNELGVRSLGRSPQTTRVVTFAVACGLTALGGALLVLHSGVAAPTLFSLNQTMLIFAMVVVGGISSIPGSLVGAVVIVGLGPVLEQVLRIGPDDSALVRPIVFGIVLVLIMRFRPAGIVRERHRLPAVPDTPTLTDEALHAARTVAVAEPGGDPRGPVVLEVEDLSKTFGATKAVDRLTLRLRRGEITALVGANGAGKSTVFNLVTGAVAPDAGRVLLGGRDITGQSPQAIARLGMVRSFQDLRVFATMTPLENVMLAGGVGPGDTLAGLLARPGPVSRHDRALAAGSAAWLDFVGLEPRIAAPTGSLSFAQQKQVAFARVLATRADVLLLDEPLSGIEGRAVEEMLGLVERMRSAGHTICIVEHSVAAISRLADWAYFMETGHVTAEGTVEDLLADPRLTEAYFGVA